MPEWSGIKTHHQCKNDRVDGPETEPKQKSRHEEQSLGGLLRHHCSGECRFLGRHKRCSLLYLKPDRFLFRLCGRNSQTVSYFEVRHLLTDRCQQSVTECL